MAVIAAVSAVAEKPSIKFTWGADAGASIDLSGNDMSAVDFNAVFGMSRGWIISHICQFPNELSE